MKDLGVLSDSIRYYHEGDHFASSHLYTVPHAGAYHCEQQYEVKRHFLDVCQLIMVDGGELAVEYDHGEHVAQAGMLVLLNCQKPHRYYSLSPNLHMRWFHFVGGSSFAYTDMLNQERGCIIHAATNSTEIEGTFERIMMAVRHNQPSTHMLSVTVHKLLALLTLLSDAPKMSEMEIAIQKTVDYIEQNYAQSNISIAELARMATISPCYYLRKFKQYHSATPHQYIQTVRMRAAKQMLTTTSKSIENIAISCGFSSVSHFIMVFRKQMQITPLQYRVMWK